MAVPVGILFRLLMIEPLNVSHTTRTVTGGVSYTVGGAPAPLTLRFAPTTLCFVTPTFVKFSGFLARKRWCLTLAMQNCHLCRHLGIQVLVFIP